MMLRYTELGVLSGLFKFFAYEFYIKGVAVFVFLSWTKKKIGESITIPSMHYISQQILTLCVKSIASNTS